MKTFKDLKIKVYTPFMVGVKCDQTRVVEFNQCQIVINKPLTESQATEEEVESYSKLIASAPDLLEALQELLSAPWESHSLNYKDSESVNNAIIKAEQAINKAI